MRIALLSTVVASWLLAAPARAEVEPIDEAGLVAAIEASDPRIARGVAEVSAAQARVTAAKGRPDPTLALDVEAPFVDGHGQPTTYLRVALPIEISGRRGLAIAAADVDVSAQRALEARARFAIVVEGLAVFHAAAHARLQVEVLADERAALARAGEIVRARARAGDASGYEVQRVELELAAYDDLVASAQLELRQARQRLAAVAGRPDAELDASSSLPLPGPPPALDALVAGALGTRADHRAARLRVDAAQRRMRAAGRGWVPIPTLTAGAMTTDLGDRTARGVVAGVAVTIPLFDRGHAERDRAAAERQVALVEARWIEAQVPAAVRAAHAALTARLAQTQGLATRQLARLDGMLAAAETAFREGDASLVELLDAHRAARDVRLRALALRREVATARLELELALGHRL